MQQNKSEGNHRYQCCLCRYFQLEGYRWGHCQILDVEVKGICPACSIAEPFFSKTKNHQDIQKPK
ncbi:MAG: hypothetical protein QNJ41_18420 [Xenococcaceae cyanobacterium MO_188.B32]|nr:hypothetical protein [Xenococcaceae cyanobacterium MO_188.B32]